MSLHVVGVVSNAVLLVLDLSCTFVASTGTLEELEACKVSNVEARQIINENIYY